MSKARPVPHADSATRTAASAASAAVASGPPACARSGRPPPPLPPTAALAARTRSTALNRAGQVGRHADDDARLALGGGDQRHDAARRSACRSPRPAPSARARAPRPDCARPASPRRPARPRPPRRRRWRASSAAPRAGRSSLRRSSSSAATRVRHLGWRGSQRAAPRQFSRSFGLRSHGFGAAAPVTASIRRTPAATAPSATILK